MDTIFLIKGPIVDDDDELYWSNTLGWVGEIKEATTFDKEITKVPILPVRTTGILVLTLDYKPVRYMDINDLKKL